MKGYIQVYTGDGKGKTTAAIGLAIRAAGAGLKVFIAQFIKLGEYSEIKALRRFSDRIVIEQYGLGRFLKGNPSEKDFRIARTGFKRAWDIMASGVFDIVILEEANVACRYGLIKEPEMLKLMDSKPADVELVITGRGALPSVIEKADLVTEMKAIKHYYERNITARVGIEK